MPDSVNQRDLTEERITTFYRFATIGEKIVLSNLSVHGFTDSGTPGTFHQVYYARSHRLYDANGNNRGFLFLSRHFPHNSRDVSVNAFYSIADPQARTRTVAVTKGRNDAVSRELSDVIMNASDPITILGPQFQADFEAVDRLASAKRVFQYHVPPAGLKSASAMERAQDKERICPEGEKSCSAYKSESKNKKVSRNRQGLRRAG